MSDIALDAGDSAIKKVSNLVLVEIDSSTFFLGLQLCQQILDRILNSKYGTGNQDPDSSSVFKLFGSNLIRGLMKFYRNSQMQNLGVIGVPLNC